MNHLYTEYYLVQKCSITGSPNDAARHQNQVDPPKDYRAVFRKQTEADAVCFQSAHAYAHACHAVVRTLLLPTGCNAHQVAGMLFWVRRVLVENNNSMGGGAATAGAHVILINGVISGRGGTMIATGNQYQGGGSLPSPDSEIDCVFVGSDGFAKAHNILMRHHHGASVSWLPVGSYTTMMDGWSNNSLLLEENMYQQHPGNAHAHSNALLHSKRTGNSSLQEHQQNHYRHSAPRASKRVCGSNRDSFTPTMATETVDLYAASYMM